VFVYLFKLAGNLVKGGKGKEDWNCFGTANNRSKTVPV